MDRRELYRFIPYLCTNAIPTLMICPHCGREWDDFAQYCCCLQSYAAFRSVDTEDADIDMETDLALDDFNGLTN